MKFKVWKASDDDYERTQHFNNLNQLMGFVKRCKHPVIVHSKSNTYALNDDDSYDGALVIYDDYLE